MAQNRGNQEGSLGATEGILFSWLINLSYLAVVELDIIQFLFVWLKSTR